MGDELGGVICHEDTVVEGERGSFKTHKSNDLRAEKVHLSTFIKGGGKCVVLSMDSSALERAGRKGASEVDVVDAYGTDVLR